MNQYTIFWDIGGELKRYLVDPVSCEYREARFLEQLHVEYHSSVFQWWERLGLKLNNELKLRSCK